MREIKRIIIHQSDSEFGDKRQIDQWHRQRGFASIGYHWVILNGWRTIAGGYAKDVDGVVEAGRPEEKIGAHTKGHNRDSIGVCLIGKGPDCATHKQVYSLRRLVGDIRTRYLLPMESVWCHRDLNPNKTCPGYSREAILALLEDQRG